MPQPGTLLDEQAIRAKLRERLPGYMVPALMETLPQLPTLASGKVDRKRLPMPRTRPAEERRGLVSPRSVMEKQIVKVWEKLFAPMQVSVQDDFFLDLGGHSLLVARMVSELRKSPRFRQLSVLDVYEHPTAERLAARCEHRQPTSPIGTHSVASSKSLSESGTRWNASLPAEVPFWRHFLCGAAQLLSLFFILSFFALQWLAPYLTYTVLIEEDYDFLPAVLGSFASLIVLYPVMLVIPIAVKWVMIGRYRAGAYPLWGTYYFRWWFTTTIEAAVPVGYLSEGRPQRAFGQ